MDATPSLPDDAAHAVQGQGAAVDLTLLVGVVDASEALTTDEASVLLNVLGSPPVEATVTLGAGPVTLSVLGNQAPSVSLSAPSAARG